MAQQNNPDLIDRFEKAARKARPAAIALTTVLSLALSHPQKVQAEDLERLHAAAPATMSVSVDHLDQLRNEPTVMADTTQLKKFRNETNPDMLPSGREAETLVFNLTGNWLVAVDDQGQPTFLPENFNRLDFVVMGSLQERFQELEGEVTAEMIKEDTTNLKLAGSYSEEAQRKLIKRIRVKLGIPTEGAEEMDLSRRHERDDGGLVDRRTEEAKSIPGEVAEDVSRDILREVRWDLERAVEDKIRDILP